ncbi:MAG: tagaturonate reductase [Rhodothermales bacterium]
MSPPRLNKKLLLSAAYQDRDDLLVPSARVFELPEKVVQFGTGGFLRAFADYFIDQANRRGLFNGRVVMVQSTGSRRAETLAEQDGLYTLWVRGLEEDRPAEHFAIIAAVSRAISAQEAWHDVLACAHHPDLELVISNTTEVGIVLDEEDTLDAHPPRSFPGKLTAFLYERARHFDYAPDKGLIILPCELVEDNGVTLQRIVRALAERWLLGARFIDWIESANLFCNTLVDRIVPGTPGQEEVAACWTTLGYEDRLLTTAEVYRLWAIEGDADLRRRLAFPEADPGVLVTGDITPYRERKIRLLNGGHTLTVPMGYLLGNGTVLDNMQHRLTGPFIAALLRQEIGPSLDVDPATVPPYIDEVLARWRNPFLKHHLIDITLQSTMKMRHRVIPSILKYYAKRQAVPRRIGFGFAGYLLFMHGVEEKDGRIYGRRGDTPYPINDDQAPFFLDAWTSVDPGSDQSVAAFVERICAREAFWGVDLAHLPGFSATVAQYLGQMLRQGVEAALREM